jgi:hypothetical protein
VGPSATPISPRLESPYHSDAWYASSSPSGTLISSDLPRAGIMLSTMFILHCWDTKLLIARVQIYVDAVQLQNLHLCNLPSTMPSVIGQATAMC